ncbi:MAG TPA: uroporphyrinogen-III synthase [Ginsengibacter sp.]
MQKNKIQILSTRPVGKELIDEAANNDILIDEISFIKTQEIIDNEIEKKITELLNQNITAVFTSMNAVDAISKCVAGNPSWKIFCIGNTTKKLVGKFFGEDSVEGFANNAHELSTRILEDSSIKNVTFFCGDIRRDELLDNLKKNGINVNEIIVYKTIETPVTLTKKYDGILFFSPSAVQSFFSKNSIHKKMKIFAIGSTTANSIKLFTQQPVIIAETPGKKNVVQMAVNHFSKSNIH